ncbi:Nucleotide-binding, alpha-beta plait [Corchorus capsularis]|uniref:Nucleotide-binding, alpha-beta plait n=1 Tax=Corchorus capsularis TaxID=210143 RepID=A0A1R3HR88_COCAP|nr:Nucleotide-binding, alpha-beta plait [Corchorus capsularis]
MLPSSESPNKSKPALNPCALSFEPAPQSGVQVESHYPSVSSNEICLLPHQQFPQHETYHYQDPFLYAHHLPSPNFDYDQYPYSYNSQHHPLPLCFPYPYPPPVHHQGLGFEYYTLPNYGGEYDSQSQAHPNPHLQPSHGEVNMETRKKKKQQKKPKCGFLPPRLRVLREKPVPVPVHGQIRVWIPRKVVHHKTNIAAADGQEQPSLDGNTSLMIRNIPNHWRRVDLQHMVDVHCRKMNGKIGQGSDSPRSEYDFLYLPMDFAFGRNLGYAFVNFTTPEAASRFSEAFSGMKWLSGDKTKICEITSADHQGRKALEQKHERSTFLCHTKSYLPVVYSTPRDGFNNSKPTTVGRCTHVFSPSNVMIMTQRKERKG